MAQVRLETLDGGIVHRGVELVGQEVVLLEHPGQVARPVDADGALVLAGAGRVGRALAGVTLQVLPLDQAGQGVHV